MRLTSFTDFALRTLMRLASEPARSFATNEIASEFRILQSRGNIPVASGCASFGIAVSRPNLLA
jgi:Rrf2 family transcriptional regulator, nitric oxide-sensitive transcriptional repressor